MKRFLIGLGTGSAALGVFLGISPLLAAGTALLIFLAGLSWLARAPLESIACERTHPQWATEDQKLLVQLHLRNDSPWPAFALSVADRFPADRDSHKTVPHEKTLWGHSRETLAYPASCSKKRGHYKIGPITVSSSDPLGLFTYARELPLQTPLTVLPKTFAIDRMPLEGRSRWDTLGLQATRKAGVSLNFFGAREYRQGDTLRYVHWPSTARHGKLIVKEFEIDASNEVTVLIDLHYFTLKGSGRETTLEYAVKVAASVARYAIEQGSLVQFLAGGQKPVRVEAGRGEMHLLTLLNELCHAQASGEMPVEDFLMQSAPLIGGGSTLVVVFNTIQIQLAKFLTAATLLRAKGVQMIAVLIDDTTFLNLWEGADKRKVDAELVPDVVRLLMAQGITVYTAARGTDLMRSMQTPYLP